MAQGTWCDLGFGLINEPALWICWARMGICMTWKRRDVARSAAEFLCLELSIHCSALVDSVLITASMQFLWFTGMHRVYILEYMKIADQLPGL